LRESCQGSGFSSQTTTTSSVGGLRRILGDYDDLDVIGEATDGQEAVALAGRLHPDIVLMDVGMPGMSGPEATHLIRTARS